MDNNKFLDKLSPEQSDISSRIFAVVVGRVLKTAYVGFSEEIKKEMEQVLYLALSESLNKRITYLEGKETITLAEYAKNNELSLAGLINYGRRQTIPVFREKGIWKICKSYTLKK